MRVAFLPMLALSAALASCAARHSPGMSSSSPAGSASLSPSLAGAWTDDGDPGEAGAPDADPAGGSRTSGGASRPGTGMPTLADLPRRMPRRSGHPDPEAAERLRRLDRASGVEVCDGC